MSRNTFIAVGILMWASVSLSSADEIVLEQLYGSGVHAFNRGDYRGAHSALSEAINGGTSDPRAYYFRGLTYLRLGREQDARLDFAKGAELEAGDSANAYPVSRSLERVQGRARQNLEQYRTTVRATAVQRKVAENRAARQALAIEEQRVLRNTAPVELPPTPSEQPSASKLVQPTPPAGNPFATPPQMPTPPAEKATTPPQAEDDPFSPKPPAGAGNDPFGGAVTPPQPKADENNPFGEPVAPAPRNSAAPPIPGDTTNRGAEPPAAAAPGAIASLFRGIVEGLRGDEDPARIPESPPSFEIPNAVRGILGNFGIGGAPPGGNAATPFPEPGAMPPSTNATPPATAPGGNDSSSNPFDAPPAGNAPAPNPFNAQTPPQATTAPGNQPATPPKPTTPMPDESDPFK